MTVLCGIDPGYKGGIAFIEYNSDSDMRLLSCQPMPLSKVLINKRYRTTYNVPRLRDMLFNNSAFNCNVFLLERFAPLEVDGKFSKAATAMGFGLIAGLIQSNPDNRFFEVWPLSWQNKMFQKITGTRRKGDTKGLSARLALSVFPTARICGPRGALKDGLSDAICIALYGTTIKETHCA